MGMKNDLSILVSETVSLYKSMELYEQQSSFNPNMPVREFMYAGKLYDKYLHSAKLNRYGKTQLPLPIPKLVVFYNGEDEKEDETIDIEVKVRMVNINCGRSETLLSACRPLWEYSWFIGQIRKASASGSNRGTMDIGDAIDHAMDVMPKDFVIRKFITANRAEVKDMCLTEYNETETMELLRQEARQEGHREGILEGIQETMLQNITNLMETTGWTADKIMEMLKIPPSERPLLFAELSRHT